MRRLASTVLIFEALVVVFAVPVAIRLEGADPVVVGTGAGVLVASAAVITGLLRYRWAYIAGSAWQLPLIASGAVVSAMYVLGVIFAALWVAAVWLGSRTYEPGPS